MDPFNNESRGIYVYVFYRLKIQRRIKEKVINSEVLNNCKTKKGNFELNL